MYPSVRAQLKRRRVSQHSPLPPRLTLCHFDLPNLLFQHPVLTQSFPLPLLSFYLAQPQSLIQWLPLVFTSFVASLSVFSSASFYTAEEKHLGTLRVQVQHNNRMWSVCVCVNACVRLLLHVWLHVRGLQGRRERRGHVEVQFDVFFFYVSCTHTYVSQEWGCRFRMLF